MKINNLGKLLILFLVFGSCSTYNNSLYKNVLKLDNNTKPINEQYPTMKTITYDYNKAYEFKNDNSDKVVIIIEGSGMLSVLGWEENNEFVKMGLWYYLLELFKQDCSVLVLEKLNFEFGKYYEYDVDIRKSYTLENLVSIYSKTINSYLSDNNFSKIVLVGYSEGACILPRVYKSISNKDKIFGLVSGGYGGLSMYEQIKIFADSQLDIHIIVKEIYQNIDSFKNDINTYPDSIGSFIGLPYPWWNSIFDYRPFDDYIDINIPVLFFHGELDINVPVESTKYIQENLPDKPFKYLIYADADHHSYMNSRETFFDLINKSLEWFNEL